MISVERPKDGLSLSGGAAKGAYQGGVLEYFLEEGYFEDGFDAILGTSVGAANAVSLGMARKGKGQLEGGVRRIRDCWWKIANTQGIWRLKFPQYLSALTSTSLGKADGFKKILREQIDLERLKEGAPVDVVAWDMLSGREIWFELQKLNNNQEVSDAVYSSASFPGAFEPIKIQDLLLTDGGIAQIAPVGRLVEKYGVSRVVSIVCRDPKNPRRMKESDFRNTLDVLARCVDGMEDGRVIADLEKAELWNLLVEAGRSTKKRVELTTVFPIADLGPPLDFSPELTKKRWQIGRDSAKAALKG